MKLLFKGQLKDTQTLRETGLTNSSKVMVLSSTAAEMNRESVQNAGATPAAASTERDAGAKKEPWSEQVQQKRCIPVQARTLPHPQATVA